MKLDVVKSAELATKCRKILEITENSRKRRKEPGALASGDAKIAAELLGIGDQTDSKFARKAVQKALKDVKI